MKTLVVYAVLAVTIFFSSGCDKADIQKTSPDKKHSSEQAHEKVPFISITASASYLCGGITPCGTRTFSIHEVNMLSVTNTNQTTYPSLMYTFYRRSVTGTIETYSYLGQYTCSDLTSTYAVTALLDGDQILIFANDPSVAGPPSGSLYYDTSTSSLTNYPVILGPSTFIFATMGSYKGQPC